MISDVLPKRIILALLAATPLIPLQGCLATRNWVDERMTPTENNVAKLEGQLEQVASRISTTEKRLASAEGRTKQVEAKIDQVDAKAAQIDDRAAQINAKVDKLDSRAAQVEAKVDKVDSKVTQVESKVDEVGTKTDKTSNTLANLRLERRMILDLKEGPSYRSNVSALSKEGKGNIDAFLSDVKSDLADNENVVFVIAGHTDSMGSERYNYQLGLQRAQEVAKYLTLEKQIDPGQVVAVSYGAKEPVNDNQTRQGREQNRRVEIRVYTQAIATSPAKARDEAALR